MGTRSIAKVFNEQGDVLLSMYGQYDGYPDGHEQDLIDFLKPIKLVNGIPHPEPENIANGDCL